MDSPLGKLYNLGAKVLMLGTDYSTCTSFHLSEVLTDKMKKEKSSSSIILEGGRQWVWYEDYECSSDDLPQTGEAFEKAYRVMRGKVGNAESILFYMKTGVDFAREWLENYHCAEPEHQD